MRTTRIPYPELMNKLEYFKSIGKKYTYERAGSSVTLTPVGGVPYYAHTLGFNGPKAKKLPKDETYFINKVKLHIDGNKLYNKIKRNYRSQSDIKYFDYDRNIREGQIFKAAYSVDVKKAYFTSSLFDGFITDELYEEGLDLDKRIMLASIGSYAKRNDVWKFDGKIERHLKTQKPKHAHVFFNQANIIYKIMSACKGAVGDKFLYYWTDGIYVEDKYAATICSNIIYLNGFNSTETKLINIERTHNSFISREWDKKAKKIEKKEYKIGLR